MKIRVVVIKSSASYLRSAFIYQGYPNDSGLVRDCFSVLVLAPGISREVFFKENCI